jgi:hypothetical protein
MVQGASGVKHNVANDDHEAVGNRGNSVDSEAAVVSEPIRRLLNSRIRVGFVDDCVWLTVEPSPDLSFESFQVLSRPTQL